MVGFSRKWRGFTLVECMVVVAVVSLVALLAVVKMTSTVDRAKVTAAESDLLNLCVSMTDPEAGYLRDMRGIPGFSLGYLRVANLFLATNLYGAVAAAGIRSVGVRVDADEGVAAQPGLARPEAFVRWDGEAERGWRGPYLSHFTGSFPSRGDRRFADDAPAESRGFFPDLFGLREPDDFLNGRDGCSIYGFPGEPALIDPWGNPYVLQIPPPQAFAGDNADLSDEMRFRFARFVSAGPDGRLDTPCFGVNPTNGLATAWNERQRRLSRQAGRIDGGDVSSRGDDLVRFVVREDVDDGEDWQWRENGRTERD